MRIWPWNFKDTTLFTLLFLSNFNGVYMALKFLLFSKKFQMIYFYAVLYSLRLLEIQMPRVPSDIQRHLNGRLVICAMTHALSHVPSPCFYKSFWVKKNWPLINVCHLCPFFLLVQLAMGQFNIVFYHMLASWDIPRGKGSHTMVCSVSLLTVFNFVACSNGLRTSV